MGAPAPRRRERQGAAALGVAAMLLGGWLAQGEFLSDDFVQLANFGHWEAQGRFWHEVAARFAGSIDGVNGFWRPLTFLTYALNHVAGGAHASGWLVVNLALHTANAVLVGLLVARWGPPPGGAARIAPAFAATLFFALAPGWEAVLWIACRYDTLATFFTLSAAWLFDARRHRLALAAAACALMSKESGAVALVVVGLLAVADEAGAPPGDRGPAARRVAVRLAPFVALGLAYVALRIALFGSATRVYVGLDVDLRSADHWSALLESFAPWWAAAFPGRSATRIVGVLAALATLVLLLPHLGMFDPSGLGGRLFYLPGALAAIALGLALAAIERDGRRGIALSLACVLLALHLHWMWRAVREFHAVHREMGAVAAGIAEVASRPHAPPAVLFIPDRLGRAAFGRNAQAGLVLPPRQPRELSRAVLVQLDTEIPDLPRKVAAGLFDALPRRPLYELMETHAALEGMQPLEPSAYLCWSPGEHRFAAMALEERDGSLPARLAAAYARAGCRSAASLK